MSASVSGFVCLTSKSGFDPRPRRDGPDSSKNPAKIGNKCSAREIGEIDFRFDWEQNLSIELHRRDTGGGELAFVSKHDLTRPKKAGLVLVNLLEPVVEAVGESKRLRPWPHERHITTQNVPELRQLVQLASGKGVADRC